MPHTHLVITSGFVIYLASPGFVVFRLNRHEAVAFVMSRRPCSQVEFHQACRNQSVRRQFLFKVVKTQAHLSEITPVSSTVFDAAW